MNIPNLCRHHLDHAHYSMSAKQPSISADGFLGDKAIVWIDLEMTGLCPETDHIVEIATIVTDRQLDTVFEGPQCVIKTDETVLSTMNDWCQTTFKKTGLLDAIRQSETSLKDAEDYTLAFLTKHICPGTAPLAGNSVSTDREFLRHWMPRVYAFLHYRTLDVSSLKLLRQFWYPELPPMEKKLTHRARDDIEESIMELKYYRKHLLKNTS